ncbi:unnamed protein product [Closterium sp. Yama58-4]|nr:unnamed protein product [Closterium sp. Yama58-4]
MKVCSSRSSRCAPSTDPCSLSIPFPASLRLVPLLSPTPSLPPLLPLSACLSPVVLHPTHPNTSLGPPFLCFPIPLPGAQFLRALAAAVEDVGGSTRAAVGQIRAQGDRCARGVGEKGKAEEIPCEELVGCGESGVGNGVEAGVGKPPNKRFCEAEESAMGERKKQKQVEGKWSEAGMSGREEEVKGAVVEVEGAVEELQECVEERVGEILKGVPRIGDKLEGRVHDEAGWTWRKAVVYQLSQPGMAEVLSSFLPDLRVRGAVCADAGGHHSAWGRHEGQVEQRRQAGHAEHGAVEVKREEGQGGVVVKEEEEKGVVVVKGEEEQRGVVVKREEGQGGVVVKEEVEVSVDDGMKKDTTEGT